MKYWIYYKCWAWSSVSGRAWSSPSGRAWSSFSSQAWSSFQIGAGAILNKCNETMRMVSQSSILESPESLRLLICTHVRQTQSLSPHKVRGDILFSHFVICFCSWFGLLFPLYGSWEAGNVCKTYVVDLGTFLGIGKLNLRTLIIRFFLPISDPPDLTPSFPTWEKNMPTP